MSGVVVGFVGKPEGRAALRRAAEEAKQRHVPLLVVNSVRATESGLGSLLPQRSKQPEKQLDDVEYELKDTLKDAAVEVHLRQLPPDADFAEELLATADEVHADLIVIGLRRRSPIGKLILGRNAQRVLLDAGCPVLAVKADE
jgi:nucleotide-binding universal stress UspA family protein